MYTLAGVVFDNASKTFMSSGSAAKTGTPVASSISSTVNSKSLLCILFRMSPSIGVLRSFAVLTACIVQLSVGWSGLVTTNSLSDAIIVDMSSSLRFGELSSKIMSYCSLSGYSFCFSLNILTDFLVSAPAMK